jgi:hypothetical protein
MIFACFAFLILETGQPKMLQFVHYIQMYANQSLFQCASGCLHHEKIIDQRKFSLSALIMFIIEINFLKVSTYKATKSSFVFCLKSNSLSKFHLAN